MQRHVPNFLTLFRIAVIPALIAAWFVPSPWQALLLLILFILAALTDFFDGWLARRWQVESKMGAYLDPVADKLLVAAILVLLVADGRAHVLPVIVIISRELLIAGLRECLAGQMVELPVTTLAKWKTAAQLMALFLLLLAPVMGSVEISLAGTYLLWAAALLAAVTGYHYTKASLRYLT